MLTEKDQINIDLYLLKKLSGSEKALFESELRARPELMAEARLQRKISQGIQKIETLNKRSELKNYLNTLNTESKNSILKENKVQSKKLKATIKPMWQQKAFKIALAASFVGIIAVGGYFYFLAIDPNQNMANNQPPDTLNNDIEKIEPTIPKHEELLALNNNQKLSDSYYTDVPQFRADVPQDMVEGVDAFYSNNPKKAISLFPENLPQLNDEFTEAQKDSVQIRIDYITFYRGLSYLKSKNTIRAISDLKIAAKSTDITINEYANWYLALSYLRNNQIPETKNLLLQIQSNEDSRFLSKASELIQKLK